MKTLTCPECSKQFTTTAHNQVCCSPACQANRIRRLKKARAVKASKSKTVALNTNDPRDVWSDAGGVSLSRLMKSRTKPKNTSAVRWRIELRRRAMQRHYGQKNLDMLPNPDLLY